MLLFIVRTQRDIGATMPYGCVFWCGQALKAVCLERMGRRQEATALCSQVQVRLHARMPPDFAHYSHAGTPHAPSMASCGTTSGLGPGLPHASCPVHLCLQYFVEDQGHLHAQQLALLKPRHMHDAPTRDPFPH